eukprot:gnl/MRDRNA2_/MRDRNA2_80327_c0_seq2.p1 gnl/MRDRNA2_/MRDRNA2_80327_c0~~gnl/MRDRNA2_/MRDRNA2_80327_c0_seq2.p1  ORF type:complete len:535 (+),score=83.40 gnl/MRDRNA2_/MRDRNA2_80327_c0_seq2:71-1606(+)
MIETLNHINLGFLVFYFLEFLVRIFVFGLDYFFNSWNLFDLLILVSGVVAEILTHVGSSKDITSMQLLRSLRMIRLLRLSRVIISFPELYNLISGLATCFRTLLWAALLTFLLLTAWSILAVEYIQPLMSKLETEGFYEMCHWCPGAFRSIMHANLTFFQIMSGDGWSLLTRAIIERHPWTAVIFAGVIFSMVFGLLNLATAVVVDAAAAARESDIRRVASRKQKERDKAWKCFTDIVVALDQDDNGLLDMEELRKGIASNHVLGAYLSVMGVEEEDLSMLFDILDEDGNGELTHEEFITQLYRLKTIETSTTTFFMKTCIDEMYKILKSMAQESNQILRTAGTIHGNIEEFTSASTGSGHQFSKPEAEPRALFDEEVDFKEMYRMLEGIAYESNQILYTTVRINGNIQELTSGVNGYGHHVFKPEAEARTPFDDEVDFKRQKFRKKSEMLSPGTGTQEDTFHDAEMPCTEQSSPAPGPATTLAPVGTTRRRRNGRRADTSRPSSDLAANS